MAGQYNLAVCQFPGGNSTKPTAPAWLLKWQPVWLADQRIAKVIPWRQADTPIDMVRNLAVKTVLSLHADYILMIDSDMAPDVEPDGKPFWSIAWQWLMGRRLEEERYREDRRHEHDQQARFTDEGSPTDHFEADLDADCYRRWPPATIAAPYVGPPPNELVYVCRWTNRETDTAAMNYELRLYDRDHAASFTGIAEVAALPTGLILYDARVFKHLSPPWFAYEYADPPFNTIKSTTEDIYQTRNASIVGMPSMCAWDCWAGHIKEKVSRKPRPYDVTDVPNSMADDFRKGLRGGGHRVQIIGNSADLVGRPPTMPYVAKEVSK